MCRSVHVFGEDHRGHLAALIQDVLQIEDDDESDKFWNPME